MELPKELFELYRQGAINRYEFVKKFSEWQENNGYNDVQGYADSLGVWLEYRGNQAQLTGGKLHFYGKEYGGRADEAVEAFKKAVDERIANLPKPKYDVDRTGDPKETVEYLYPDTAAFNCLSPREQKEILSH